MYITTTCCCSCMRNRCILHMAASTASWRREDTDADGKLTFIVSTLAWSAAGSMLAHNSLKFSVTLILSRERNARTAITACKACSGALCKRLTRLANVLF